MPNKYTRDSNNVLVPKITIGGLVDATVVNADHANSSIQASKLSYYKSAEQTGTASEQTVSHGLSRTPALVIVIPTKVATAGDTFVEGVHTSTLVKVTASTGSKFIVVAL